MGEGFRFLHEVLQSTSLGSPRQESNLHRILRRDASYPLNDEECIDSIAIEMKK